MAFAKVWERENDEKLTLKDIIGIVGHITYRHEEFEQSLHFRLKLKQPNGRDSAEYLVKPWDICWNTLKAAMFRDYFTKYGVNDWNDLIHSSSNHTSPKPLKPPPAKRQRIDNDKSSLSLSPFTPETTPGDHEKADSIRVPIVPHPRVETAATGPQQLTQKLHSISQTLSMNLSEMTVEYMLKNYHLLNYLVSQCTTFQFQIAQQLKDTKKSATDSSFEFVNLSNKMANYKTKMHTYGDEIRSYDEQIKMLMEYKERAMEKQQRIECKMNTLNDELMKNAKRGMELRQNAEESKYELEMLRVQKERTEAWTQRLLNEIESVPISRWSKTNVIDWILCISKGYFTQFRYSGFIGMLRTSNAICERFGTAIDPSWLHSCGLNKEEDVSIFVSNHFRLISKQMHFM
eukprot:187604_1